MTQPGDTTLTRRELVLEVAEYLGVASFDEDNGTTGMPENRYDQLNCEKIVDRGWEEFLALTSAWSFLHQVYSLPVGPDSPYVVDGDTSRYRMPWFFGGQMGAGAMTYQTPGPCRAIELVDESVVRSAYSRVGATTTGDPWWVSFERPPIVNDNQGDRKYQWQAYVYPKPTQNRTIQIPIRVQPTMKDWPLDEPHCAGSLFNNAVRAAVIARAEMEWRSEEQTRRQVWQEAAARAVELDKGAMTRPLGKLGPTNPDRTGRPVRGITTLSHLGTQVYP
jgi:hypothetical protein